MNLFLYESFFFMEYMTTHGGQITRFLQMFPGAKQLIYDFPFLLSFSFLDVINPVVLYYSSPVLLCLTGYICMNSFILIRLLPMI